MERTIKMGITGYPKDRKEIQDFLKKTESRYSFSSFLFKCALDKIKELNQANHTICNSETVSP